MRPIIGICINYDELDHKFTLRDFYVSSIVEAGGTPLLLPPVEEESLINQYYRLCDGFLFTGGGDVDPVLWGELPHPMLGEINPLRDLFEIALAKQLLLEHKPVLGICRGCQVMNVAAGGTIIQHINSEMSHDQKAPRYYPFHDIVVEKNTLLGNIVEEERIRVNSFHHQAVGNPGEGLKVSARAMDGVIEAIEREDGGFYLGVQWHPECMRDRFAAQLFTALINKSKQL